ncbi:MAG: hypothetical protein HY359_11600 [Candidatus Rokubacteria bacterium]|nr:hypothetical protein [Candidatus Rokubacteria bacterium]
MTPGVPGAVLIHSGDPDRIVCSLRRFDRHPVWLPVHARAEEGLAAIAAPPTAKASMLLEKEKDHATV